MNQRVIVEWDVEIQRRRIQLANALLTIVVTGGLATLIVAYLLLLPVTDLSERAAALFPFVVGWLVVVAVWALPGIGHRARALALVLLTTVAGAMVFAQGGLAGSGRIWLLLPLALAFVLLDRRAGVVAGVASALVYALIAVFVGQGWVVPEVPADPYSLQALTAEIPGFVLTAAALAAILWAFDRGLQEALAGVGATQGQLQEQAQEMEATNERLRQQAARLRTAAEIARVGSSILQLDTLMEEIVRRIQEGFASMEVYYVGLFMVDGTRQSADLRAATGEAGRLLMTMGHKVPLDETSTVGWCISRRQARVAADTGGGAAQFGHTLLSLTRSEVALPLNSRGRILGALTVQSVREMAFGEGDVAILQMMADQIAVAIDNAILFARTEAAFEEAQTVHQRYLARTWREFLGREPVVRADHNQSGERLGEEDWLRQARQEAKETGQVVTVSTYVPAGEEGAMVPYAALVVPLKLRGLVVGTLLLCEEHRVRSWSAEDVAMAEAVAEQVALTVENLRLVEETQRHAASERLLGEVTAGMRASLDMETVLKNAASKIGQEMGLAALDVRLVPGMGTADDR